MKSKFFFQIFEFLAGDLLEMESLFSFCREVIPVRKAGVFRKTQRFHRIVAEALFSGEDAEFFLSGIVFLMGADIVSGKQRGSLL